MATVERTLPGGGRLHPASGTYRTPSRGAREMPYVLSPPVPLGGAGSGPPRPVSYFVVPALSLLSFRS